MKLHLLYCPICSCSFQSYYMSRIPVDATTKKCDQTILTRLISHCCQVCWRHWQLTCTFFHKIIARLARASESNCVLQILKVIITVHLSIIRVDRNVSLMKLPNLFPSLFLCKYDNLKGIFSPNSLGIEDTEFPIEN